MNLKNKGQSLAEYALALGGIGALVVAVLAVLPILPKPSLGSLTVAEPAAAPLTAGDVVLDAADVLAESWTTIDEDIVTSMTLDDIDYNKGHADSQHAQDAQRIRDCIKRDISNGTMQAFKSPFHKDRFVIPCEVTPGVWGLQIIKLNQDGKYDSITAFIKRIFECWDDVQAYLRNYTPTVLP